MSPKQQLLSLALSHGFLGVGVARARRLHEEEAHLKEWLQQGYQGSMGYMERNMDKRLDPALLVPGAKTVVCFLYNYHQPGEVPKGPKIARYAWGEDYHRVVKDRLYDLVSAFEQQTGVKVNGRVFTDSAPVMERQWAALSGLGWIGKNSLLLRKGVGSYFFIATLISDLELEPDEPVTDHCGTCTACIDACPTNAIVADGVVDARLCISYQTIERREPVEESVKPQLHHWVFGCDICQEVCPWNRFALPHTEQRFEAGAWQQLGNNDWPQLSREQFEDLFGSSPVSRAGYDKFMDNLKAAGFGAETP